MKKSKTLGHLMYTKVKSHISYGTGCCARHSTFMLYATKYIISSDTDIKLPVTFRAMLYSTFELALKLNNGKVEKFHKDTNVLRHSHYCSLAISGAREDSIRNGV